MPDITEAKIVFTFEIDDSPIRKISQIMDDFRETQLKSNEQLTKSLEQMNKKTLKNIVAGYVKGRKELSKDLKQKRNLHKQHGEWLKGINDKYKTNVENLNKKLTSDVKSNAKKQSNAVKEAYSGVEVNVKKALSGISKSFSKQTRNVAAETSKLGKDFSKITGAFRLDIQTSEMDAPVNDMRTMMANLKAVGVKGSQDFNAAVTRGYRLMSSNNADEIKQGQQIIENTLKRNYTNQLSMLRENTGKQMNLILNNKKQQIEAHKNTLARLLQNDKLSDKKRLELEKSFQDKIKSIKTTANRQVISLNQRRNNAELRMAQNHSKRMSMVQRTGGRQQQIMPGRKVKGFLQNTPIFGEMSNAASGLTSSLGPLGSALGGLGPIGIGVAAVLGATVGLFTKSAAAAGAYHDGLARVETLLTDSQMNMLPAAMDKVRGVSLSTGQAIDGLTDTVYNVISAAPRLANNLDAVASITEKAARASVGLGIDTNSTAKAMMNMMNASGMNSESVKNQQMVLDVLANTMKQGVIPSGEVLSGQIAKNAPLFASLNENINDTVTVLGAYTAHSTAMGVSVEETQTQLKAFGQELIDSGKQAKLLEAGIKGINPKGKIDDWKALTTSIASNMDEVMNIFTSSEAKNAVRILAKNGGDAFNSLIDSMKNAGGTSEAMFSKMANTSKMASDKLSVSWNNLMISMGSGSESMLTGIQNGITSIINSVNSLFETSEQAMDKALISANQYIDLSSGITDVNALLEDALVNIGDKAVTDKAFEAIKLEALSIEDLMPGMAMGLQDILSSDGTAAEKFAKLAVEMGKVKEISDLMARVNIGSALKEGGEALSKMAENLDDASKSQKRMRAQSEILKKGREDLLNLEKQGNGQSQKSINIALKMNAVLNNRKGILEKNVDTLVDMGRPLKGLFKNSVDINDVIKKSGIEMGKLGNDIRGAGNEMDKAQQQTVSYMNNLFAVLSKEKNIRGELLTNEQIRGQLKNSILAIEEKSIFLAKIARAEIEGNIKALLKQRLITETLDGINKQSLDVNSRLLDLSNESVVKSLKKKNLLSQMVAIQIAEKQALMANMDITDKTGRSNIAKLKSQIANLKNINKQKKIGNNLSQQENSIEKAIAAEMAVITNEGKNKLELEIIALEKLAEKNALEITALQSVKTQTDLQKLAEDSVNESVKARLLNEVEIAKMKGSVVTATLHQAKTEDEALKGVINKRIAELKTRGTAIENIIKKTQGKIAGIGGSRTPSSPSAPSGVSGGSVKKEQKFSADQVASAITERINAEKAAWEQAQADKKAIIQTENDQKKKELNRHAKFLEGSKKKYEAELKLIGERLESERKFNLHLGKIASDMQIQAINLAKAGAKEAGSIFASTKNDTSFEAELAKKIADRAEQTKAISDNQKQIVASKKQELSIEEESYRAVSESLKNNLSSKKAKALAGYGNVPGAVSETLLEVNRQDQHAIEVDIEATTKKYSKNISRMKEELVQLQAAGGFPIAVAEWNQKMLSMMDKMKSAAQQFEILRTAIDRPIGENTPKDLNILFDTIESRYRELVVTLREEKVSPAAITALIDQTEEAQAVIGKLTSNGFSSFTSLLESPSGGSDITLDNAMAQLEIRMVKTGKTVRETMKDTMGPLLNVIDNINTLADVSSSEKLSIFRKTFDKEALVQYGAQLSEIEKSFKKQLDVVLKINKPVREMFSGDIGRDKSILGPAERVYTPMDNVDFTDIAGSVNALGDMIENRIGKSINDVNRNWKAYSIALNATETAYGKQAISASEIKTQSAEIAKIAKDFKNTTGQTLGSYKATIPLVKETRRLQEAAAAAGKKYNSEISDAVGNQKNETQALTLTQIAQNDLNDSNKENNKLFAERKIFLEKQLKAILRMKELELKQAKSDPTDPLTLKDELVFAEAIALIKQDIFDLTGLTFEETKKQAKATGDANKNAEKAVKIATTHIGKLKQLNKEKKNYDKTGKSAIQIANDLADFDKKRVQQIEAIMKKMESLSDLSLEVITSYSDIQSMFQAGDTGGATEAIGDLTKKVGVALMDSGTPGLITAGAVLLGAGMIAKFMGKISSLVNGPEATRVQQGEIYVASQERLLAIYSAQRQQVEFLSGMGDRSLDTARERLDIEEELLRQQMFTAGMTGKSYKEVSDALLKQKKSMADVDQWLKTVNATIANTVDQAGMFDKSDARKRIIDSIFGSGGALAGKKVEVLGQGLVDDLNKGIASANELEAAIENIGAYLSNEMSTDAASLTELENTMKNIQDIIEQIQKSFEELMSLRVDLIVDLGLTNNEIIQAAQNVSTMYRDELNTKLAEIAPEINWASLSPDEVKANVQDILAGLSDEDQIIFGADILESYTDWSNSINNVESALDSLLKKQTGINDARTEINPNDEQYLSEGDALERNLKLVTDALVVAEATNASEEYILELKKQQYDIEQEILGLGNDGNSVLSEKIRLLHEERQAAIARVREGTATQADRQLITSLDNQIIAAMKEAGASPEEISATNQALAAASYEEGTANVPRNQLAYLHEGEAVLTKSDNALLGRLQSNINASNVYMKGILDTYSATNIKHKPMRMDYFGDAKEIENTTINLNITINSNSDSDENLGEIIYEQFAALHKKDHIKSGSYNGRA